MLGTAFRLSAYISVCTHFVGITLLPLNIFYMYSCVLLHDLRVYCTVPLRVLTARANMSEMQCSSQLRKKVGQSITT